MTGYPEDLGAQL